MTLPAVLSKESLSFGSQLLCHHSTPAEWSCKALVCPSLPTRSGLRRKGASVRCCPSLQAANRGARFLKTSERVQGSRKVAWGQPSVPLSWQTCQRREHQRDSHYSASASGQESTVVSESVEGKDGVKATPEPYKDGPMDVLFFKAFRRAMVREAGWDSPAPGYDGLIEVARKLVARHKSREETEDAAVRILQSLFPPFLLPAFRKIITPLGDGRPAAVLTAWVTQWSCQWLMGRCQLNDVQLADGTTQWSGVLVEKCKYLEESGCAGICVHTCKMPTQAFMKNDMGIPLTMEPNYEDYSCQFNFGVEPPSREVDEALKVGCLSICPTAKASSVLAKQCPQVAVL